MLTWRQGRLPASRRGTRRQVLKCAEFAMLSRPSKSRPGNLSERGQWTHGHGCGRSRRGLRGDDGTKAIPAERTTGGRNPGSRQAGRHGIQRVPAGRQAALSGEEGGPHRQPRQTRERSAAHLHGRGHQDLGIPPQRRQALRDVRALGRAYPDRRCGGGGDRESGRPQVFPIAGRRGALGVRRPDRADPADALRDQAPGATALQARPPGHRGRAQGAPGPDPPPRPARPAGGKALRGCQVLQGHLHQDAGRGHRRTSRVRRPCRGTSKAGSRPLRHRCVDVAG